MPAALKPLAHPIDDLVLDPKNARQHGTRNMEAVKQSLERFGWRGIVIVREGDKVVLAGNARVQAARDLGWKEAPVLFVKDDSEESIRYALADNRTAELATWDYDVLSELTASLTEDVTVPGFSEDELASLTETPVLPDEKDDEVERLNEHGRQTMTKRMTTVVLRVRVPKAAAAAAQEAIVELANRLGGELL